MKFISLFFLSIFVFENAANAYSVECSKDYSFLVFEENNGDILFEQRSDKVSYPASLVKLMTLYLTFEALESHKITPEQVLTVSARGEEISNVNKIGTLHLKEGDKITVREAIRAVIVKSFNEAAVTLGEAVGGDEWNFVHMMNEKARKLGMINSSFRNASGLHEEGQYTTSYDLARLVVALKKDFPGYYYLFSLKEFTYNDVKYETHNHVLVDYEGAEGMKTGFTSASGYNLISSAIKNDRRIISVLLGCSTFQQRDNQTKELLDDAFKRMQESEKDQPEVRLNKGFKYDVNQRHDEYEDKMRFGNGSENE